MKTRLFCCCNCCRGCLLLEASCTFTIWIILCKYVVKLIRNIHIYFENLKVLLKPIIYISFESVSRQFYNHLNAKTYLKSQFVLPLISVCNIMYIKYKCFIELYRSITIYKYTYLIIIHICNNFQHVLFDYER